MNTAIREMVNTLAPISEAKKAEIIEELTP